MLLKFVYSFINPPGLYRRTELQRETLEILQPYIWSEESSRSFAQDSLAQFWHLMTPRELVDHAKTRIGGEKDGGYVIAGEPTDFKYAISIGVGNDNSSDIYLAKLGIPVFEFDHTVDREPVRHKLVKFHKIGIGHGVNLINLGEMIELTKIDDNSLLLLDVDGAEYDFYAGITPEALAQFTQVVIEMHDLSGLLDSDLSEKIIRLTRALTANHHVIHVHANNFRPILNVNGVSLPTVLEVTLVRKDKYTVGEFDLVSPQSGLDFPNDKSVPDPELKIPHPRLN